jgi:hypothetical protein
MVIILAGDFGAGKTTYAKKNFIEPAKQRVLAYALLKKDLPGVPTTTDFVGFVTNAVKLNNTTFFIDEASTAFPDEKPDARRSTFNRNMLVWLLNARKFNNILIIVYHDMGEIPLWLVKKSDYFVRFRTNDLLQYQISRFSSFPNIVKNLKDHPTMPDYKYYELQLRK